MESNPIDSHQGPTYLAFKKPLDLLKSGTFDERDETKKNFEVLYKLFQKMKSEDKIISICEYCSVMNEIIEFVKCPQFKNYYKTYDKKLTKNVLKRCLVDPLS